MSIKNEKVCIPSKQKVEKALQERFSPEIYDIFKNSEVAIAGLGGLGSNIAVMLARTGIGHLHLVDYDRVDITNLNRQVYCMSHLEMPKTNALKGILQDINPYINITTDTIRVTQDNAVELFGRFQIVCEAFDQANSKAMLVNTLLEQCKETKIVSGSGMAGYGSSNNIQTQRVMKNLYICGDRVSDLSDGLAMTSSRVSICAGHQANMVIRLILGFENE